MKVRSGGIYRQPHREAQAFHREARREGSVYQNLGSMNKNLIPRLYKRVRLLDKPKPKRYA